MNGHKYHVREPSRLAFGFAFAFAFAFPLGLAGDDPVSDEDDEGDELDFSLIPKMSTTLTTMSWYLNLKSWSWCHHHRHHHYH